MSGFINEFDEWKKGNREPLIFNSLKALLFVLAFVVIVVAEHWGDK